MLSGKLEGVFPALVTPTTVEEEVDYRTLDDLVNYLIEDGDVHGLNGVDKGPRAWIVRENEERNKPTPYEDYPNPAASPVALHLVAGSPERGQLRTTPQQIGLMMFSSDKDFTLWPTPGTELTIDLDATSLALPVVGGGAALVKAIEKQPAKSNAAD